MYRDGDVYRGTGFWWDEDDNEYAFSTTWQFEANYPDAPDCWNLIDVEFEDCSILLNNLQYEEVHMMCRNGGHIWQCMERYGLPADATEVDYV